MKIRNIKSFVSTSILTCFFVAGANAPLQAQEAAKDEAAPTPHCSPKIAELCANLNTFFQAGGTETWKIGLFGSTACTNSVALQSERRARRDRLEYDARLAKQAKENKQEFTPWVPRESAVDFTSRTNSQCDGSYAYYCSEMQREAEGMKDAGERQRSVEFVASVCASQTASAPAAAPAPAAPAAPRR